MSAHPPYPTARQQTAAARPTAAITNTRLCLGSPVDPLRSGLPGLLAKPAKPANDLGGPEASLSRPPSGDGGSASRRQTLDLERQRAVFCRGGPLLGAEWLGPALNAQQIISLWGLCLGLLFAKRASPDSQGTVCHPLFVKPTPSRPTSRVGFGETGKAGFDASHLPPWLIFFYFPPTAFHRLILLVSDERETRKLTARGCQTRLLNQHVIPNQHHPWAV